MRELEKHISQKKENKAKVLSHRAAISVRPRVYCSLDCSPSS